MASPVLDFEAACSALARQDRQLGRCIARIGPCRLEVAAGSSPYQGLVEAIVYQQLTPRSARTIYDRLRRHLGRRGRCPTPDRLEQASLEELRALGLSRVKAQALKDLAVRARLGEVPTRRQAERLTDEQLIAILTEIRGVGRWTAQMILIFTLGRPDVLPCEDYGLRRGLAQLLGNGVLPHPSEVAERGEAWRPYRTIASWYLWRLAELATAIDRDRS